MLEIHLPRGKWLKISVNVAVISPDIKDDVMNLKSLFFDKESALSLRERFERFSC